jgi:hypothetical protein
MNTYLFNDSLAQEKMPLVYGVENTGADYPMQTMPAFNKLPTIQALPDPFKWFDGSGQISNYSDWRIRRNEIGAMIQSFEIGLKPVRPDTIQASYSGGVLTVNVTVNGKTLKLTSQVILPSGTGPFPAVIGMNSSSGSIPSSIFSSRNIAQITFSHDQVTTYNNPQNSNPYYLLYGPTLTIVNTGQYSAWAWGVSRIIDGLELVQNVLPIDLKHIAVTGCSYAGKMALFAGAFDERIALTIAQESGGGGATSWRYSQTETSGSVETIGATSNQWFMDGMSQFSGANVSKLPEDHHELCAMCAPRALLVTGNPDYTWLSNPSCYVNSKAAQQVYNTLGIPDRFGFSIVGGHLHCAVPSSQTPEIEAFVDKFLLGKDTVNTNIVTTPYNIDLIPWITWTNPTLSNGSTVIKWTTLNYPSNLQSGVDTTITFRWNKVEGAEKYFIQVTSDPVFASIDKSDSTTIDTVKTIAGLSIGKKYYWHVRIKSASGLGPWCNVWSFITAIPLPTKPQLVSAIPTYSDRADYFTFKWNKLRYSDDYLFQVSDDQTFSTIFRLGITPDTVRVTSGFVEGVRYYWRVQGRNIAGSGPWSNLQNFTATLAGIQEKKGIPAEYSISQNYPNPFNPSTTIKFALLQPALTKIDIYDLLGREVQILITKELEAGYHEVNFNADNFPSGVYYYKIQSGNFNQTKKMTLIK